MEVTDLFAKPDRNGVAVTVENIGPLRVYRIPINLAIPPGDTIAVSANFSWTPGTYEVKMVTDKGTVATQIMSPR